MAGIADQRRRTDSKGRLAALIRRRRPFGLVAQVVLSFVLLLIAGSVIETLRRLQVTDPGFAVSGRLYAYIYFPSAPTPESRPSSSTRRRSTVCERCPAF